MQAQDCPEHQYLHPVTGACTDCPEGLEPTSGQNACEEVGLDAFAVAAVVICGVGCLLPFLFYFLYKRWGVAQGALEPPPVAQGAVQPPEPSPEGGEEPNNVVRPNEATPTPSEEGSYVAVYF